VSIDGTQFSLSEREYQNDKSSIWRELSRIGAIVEGPPHPGLDKRVSTFIDKFEAIETQRHEENQEKLQQISNKLGSRSLITNIAMVIATIAGVMVAIAAVAATLYLAHHAEMEPLDLLGHPRSSVVSLQQNPPQSVGLPASFALR
jgi:hypothetical protein